MLKKWFMAVLVTLCMAMPSLAFAQDAGVDAGVAAVEVAAEAAPAVTAVPPEGFDLIPAMISAAQGGDWGIFVALLIMALVWLVTKVPFIADLIQGEAKVWVSAVSGTLLAVGVAIFTSNPGSVVEWLSTIFSGLMVGLAATGLWELFKRLIKKEPIDANGDGKLD